MDREKIKKKLQRYPIVLGFLKFLYSPIRILRQRNDSDKLANPIIEEVKKLNFQKKIFYIGIPEHDNLGDLAQTYCTRLWIKECYADYVCVEMVTRAALSKKFLRFLRSIITNEDVFIFQSGYCTQNKHLDHLMHKKIIKNFCTNTAIFLPQTVNISTEKEKRITKHIFSKNPKIVFLARDAVSEVKASEFLSQERIISCPDIVTTLIGKYKFNSIRTGVLMCLRNDAEKFYSDKELNVLEENLKTIFGFVEKIDTNSPYPFEYTKTNLKQVLEDMFEKFSKYELVITDRYHGTIFSLISETPVIVIKTQDHKVRTGVDWFKDLFKDGFVQYEDDLENVPNIAKNIVSRDYSVGENAFFQDYYNQLKKKINLKNL